MMKHYQWGYFNTGVGTKGVMRNCCNIALQSNTSLSVESVDDQLVKVLYHMAWHWTGHKTKHPTRTYFGLNEIITVVGTAGLGLLCLHSSLQKQHQHSFKCRKMFCFRMAQTTPALFHLSLVFWSAEHLQFPLISVGVEDTQRFRKPGIMHWADMVLRSRCSTKPKMPPISQTL